ncbi:bestrophin family ion channel [Raineya orbicola]|uniref:Bestrophin, RFP-TM, chloride channel n=1 Tax=Raineya orbicola TaxID=2016530 RepID=A0A2N3ICG3_9BACT|nr:bestrophin family ion channel [Raineya orbicola]PKQ68011.1 hypothetical protein Rain11_1822 [Raineya orbicola]
MKLFRSLWNIINYKTFIITTLSVIGTYYCKEFNFVGDLPITLVGTAIIFPVVFSINSAYRRREDAIMSYASMKSNFMGLFYASKNWVSSEHENYCRKSATLLLKTMGHIIAFFTNNQTEKQAELEKPIYRSFDEISLFIQTFRKVGVTPSELSRADQYFTRAVADFERMKKILYYRTPYSLRVYAIFFLYSFPVLYAPYFAYHLKDSTYPVIGYISAVLYSFVFVSLINIQEQLENPFDQYGEDDIQLDLSEMRTMIENVSIKDVANFKTEQNI